MLVVARYLSYYYPTSIHNAGDHWEFGQFFEGGGSLQQQHAQLNERVGDKQAYTALPIPYDREQTLFGMDLGRC